MGGDITQSQKGKSKRKLNQTIEQSSGSSKTTFKSLEKVHSFYENKLGFYRQWHIDSRSSKVHFLILGLFITLSIVTAALVLPSSPDRTKAGAAYYVATTGNDTSGNGSSSSPWKTIQKAVNTVSPGDTINVRAGTYNERVVANKAGTSSNRITIQGYQGERPVVSQGFELSGSYVTVKQFEITPGSSSSTHVALSGSNNVADDIYAHDLQQSSIKKVFGIGGSNNTVQGSRVENWATYNNLLTPAVTVSNGTLKTTKFSGVSSFRIAEFDANSVGEGNDFIGPNEDGTVFIEGSNVLFKNNKLYKTGKRVGSGTHTDPLGIQKTSASGNIHDVVIDGNIFSGPPSPWTEPADGNRQWEGPPFYIFFFGMNTPVYSNITITNNVFLPGADRPMDQNLGPESIGGTNNIYNNIFVLGGSAIEGPTWRWKNNINFENNYNNYSNNPAAADYNLWVNKPVDSRDGSHSITTNQSISQLFVNPTMTANTRYGLDADWHLKSGSAAIGAGIGPSADSYVPTLDRDGKARSGSTTDIGPYLFGSGGTPPPADTQNPSVSLSSPASGATVSGSTNITATASDNVGVAKVEFLVDGNVVNTDTSSPYSYSWDTTSVTNGVHALTARAYDAAGNNATSASRTVTVSNTVADTQNPSVSLTSPSNGATLSGNATISAQATDNVGVTEVDFLVDGNVVNTDTSSPYSYSWNTVSVTNGVHTLTARAYDEAGNSGTSAARNVTVSNAVPDTLDPNVSLTAPASGATLSGSTNIQATASDNVGVAKVEFLVDGNVVNTDTSSPYSYSWNTGSVTDGNHSVSAKAYDEAGNSRTSSSVSVKVDNNAPSVTLTGPANGASVSGTTVISAVASDAGTGVQKVEFYVDGVLKGQDTTSPYSYSWDTRSYAAGNHTIYVRAIDNMNRSTTSSQNTVNISISQMNSTISANPSSTDAPGEISVTLTLRDANNNPVSGHNISFTTSQEALDVFTPVSAVTNAQGVAQTVVSSIFSHTSTIAAYDNTASLQIKNVSVTFTNPSDTAPPTVNLTSPAAGATVSGNITISADASDNFGVDKVEFYLDDTLIDEDGSSPYSVSWHSALVPNGAHTVKAKAYDGSGNSSTDTVDITVSNQESFCASLTASATRSKVMATAGSYTTITVKAQDILGNDMYGKTVAVSGTRELDVLTPGSSHTDASGTITYTFKSKSVGESALTFTVDGQEAKVYIMVTKSGDVNGDNKVDLTDLAFLMSRWNQSVTNADYADVNCSGKVDTGDLAVLMAGWGN